MIVVTGKNDCRCSHHAEVYPRVYGETSPATNAIPRPRGLSPRVRGNPVVVCGAGGPSRVYPRVYGETYVMAEPIC